MAGMLRAYWILETNAAACYSVTRSDDTSSSWCAVWVGFVVVLGAVYKCATQLPQGTRASAFVHGGARVCLAICVLSLLGGANGLLPFPYFPLVFVLCTHVGCVS